VKIDTFFAELKRRNVYKVAVAYAVVGWLVIQISSTVFPTFHAPEWILQTLLVLVALGFPIALIIAWAFELTPEGLKRTEVADAAEQSSKRRAWIYVVGLGAAISLGVFFLGRYVVSHSNAAAEPTRGPLASSQISEKSIAVLPFENLSSDKENSDCYRVHQLFNKTVHWIAGYNSYRSIETVFDAAHEEGNQEYTGPNKHDCWKHGIAAGSERSR